MTWQDWKRALLRTGIVQDVRDAKKGCPYEMHAFMKVCGVPNTPLTSRYRITTGFVLDKDCDCFLMYFRPPPAGLQEELVEYVFERACELLVKVFDHTPASSEPHVVPMIPPPPPSAIEAPPEPRLLHTSPPPAPSGFVPKTCIALASFEGADYGLEYLSFRKDNLVSILAEPDEQGWQCGRLVSNGRWGWFPANYVSPEE